MYIIEWEWDDSKNEANTKKHGVSFEVAPQVFTDPRAAEKNRSWLTQHQKWGGSGELENLKTAGL